MGGRGGGSGKTKSAGGGGSAEASSGALANDALKQIDKQEQLSLDNGTRVTKLDKNLYLVDGQGVKGVLLNKSDTRDYLKTFSSQLKNKGAVTPLEQLIKDTKPKNIVDIKPRIKKQPPKFEKTSIAMGKVLREVNTKNKLESGSANIQRIDSKSYLVNHPDYDRPRVLNQSELRRFIRDNENDFDGFRKKA